MSTLTLTTIQTDLIWEDKVANLTMLEEKIMSIHEKTELVILPEMFNTGFTMQPEKFAETVDGNSIKWMKTIAAKKRIVITGSLAIKEGDNYFNRLIWMLPNGQYGFYDKRHLFGYANEDQHYTAGTKRFIASLNGWKINLQVCYDLRFPVWARQTAITGNTQAPEFDLLIYVANWPERRSLAWTTLLQARAIENQCFVVGVNRVGNDGQDIYHGGNSMVIDPLGEVMYNKKDEEAIFTITLKKNQLQEVREKLPFLKDADSFLILPNDE